MTAECFDCETANQKLQEEDGINQVLTLVNQELIRKVAAQTLRIEKLEAVADRASDVHWAYVNKEQLSYRMTLLGKALTALDAKEEEAQDG